MNVFSAISSASERAPARDIARDRVRDAARLESAARSREARNAVSTRDQSVDATVEPDDDTEENTDESARTPAENFQALLALLAKASDSSRPEVTSHDTSFIDRLLSGATLADGADGDHTQAGDALRYGLLKLTPGDASASATTTGAAATNVTDAVATAAMAAQLNIASIGTGAEALPQDPPRRTDAARRTLDASATGATSASDRDRALEALARATSRSGTSAEQLMALGDVQGAAARQSLDALLNTAGTPAGARLAALQLLTSTQAGALGGDSTGNDTTTNAMTAVAALRARFAASGTGDVTTSTSELSGVSSELQAKVQRVMDRMKSEYGHDVTIVETTRSQDRQNWLYEQGRTRPGQIVTWTRDSAHTRGEAVDVKVDGTYSNAEGYARLQQIAREEGLRTLGSRDPGHLELARSTSDGTNAALASATRTGRANAASESDATGNSVARVAGVAGVAGVARVAAAANADASTSDRGSRDQSSGARTLAFRRADTRRDSATSNDTTGAAYSTVTSTGTGSHAVRETTVTQADQVGGSAQADRVAEIQQMRDRAPATPISRLTMNVDGTNGASERITVDVRGNNVSAHIATDAETADRLRLRTAELQDALGRHGLDGDTVRISNTVRTTDRMDAVRATSAEQDTLKLVATASASQDGAGASGQQNRPTRDHSQDDARREQAARAREDRQQQTGQHAGQQSQQRSAQDAWQDAQDQQYQQRRQTLFTGNV